jgi:predicted nucleotidyltransferase component of viral defense system
MLPDKKYFKNYCEGKNIPWRERDVLREYLQTQILKALSASDYNDTISFLGGTSLRFIHEIPRFSEDLDFDLVKKDSFSVDGLEKELNKRVGLLGFAIDTRTKTTENIHIIYFKFRQVLQEFGFNVSKDEKFLIKFEIDYTPYNSIKTETKFADSFNERFPVLINTLPTLFAQKIIALKMRPYQKGRDFYDLVWFLAQKNIEPNYAIFKEKNIAISNRREVVSEMQKIISGLDLKQAAKDVERFLFYPEQAKWILNLSEYLKGFSEK